MEYKFMGNDEFYFFKSQLNDSILIENMHKNCVDSFVSYLKNAKDNYLIRHRLTDQEIKKIDEFFNAESKKYLALINARCGYNNFVEAKKSIQSFKYLDSMVLANLICSGLNKLNIGKFSIRTIDTIVPGSKGFLPEELEKANIGQNLDIKAIVVVDEWLNKFNDKELTYRLYSNKDQCVVISLDELGGEVKNKNVNFTEINEVLDFFVNRNGSNCVSTMAADSSLYEQVSGILSSYVKNAYDAKKIIKFDADSMKEALVSCVKDYCEEFNYDFNSRLKNDANILSK
jgi:predicted nucleic-acid-binding Zn-ribbon protein